MLIWTAKFSKKKAVLAVMIFGVLLSAIVLLAGHLSRDAAPAAPQLCDNASRVSYLQTLGWQVKPEPVETLQFLLPAALGEPYLTYNQLQLSQGFDLAACCGKQVSRYTYTVTNYPNRPDGVQANLYVCEERPVAGDVCYPGNNGFQEPLIQSFHE